MIPLSTLQLLATEATARAENLTTNGQIHASADPSATHPWFQLPRLANQIGLPVHSVELDGEYLCCPCCDSIRLEAFAGDCKSDHFSAIWNEQQLKATGHADFHEVPSSITVRTYIACQTCHARFAVVLEDHATGRVLLSLVELPSKDEGDI